MSQGLGTAVSICDQCIVSGTNFLTLVVLGRSCGLYQVGVYSLAFAALVTLVALQESFLVAPFTVVMNRFQRESRRLSFGTATLLQQLLLGGAVSTGLFALGASAALLPRLAHYTPLLMTLAATAPLWLHKEFVRRACYVEFQMGRALLLDSLASGLQLSLLALFWMQGEVSVAVSFAAAAAGHAAAAFLWWSAFRPSLVWSLPAFRRALRLNWGLGSWGCVGRLTEMLQEYGVHWLLALTAGPAATGAYAAASSLLAMANPVLMGIGNLLASETARAYARGGSEALRRTVFRASCQVTLITAIFAVLVSTTVTTLWSVTFGGTSEGQAGLVAILAAGMLAGIVGFGSDNGLRALARPAENFKAALAGLLVSLAAAVLLVGPWAAIGAAWGALLGELVASLVRVVSFLRFVNGRSARGVAAIAGGRP